MALCVLGEHGGMTATPGSGFCCRDGRLVVVNLGVDAIRSANREIEHASGLARAENPAATPLPHITAMVGVFDLNTRSFHLINVRRLDWHAPRFPAPRNVVAFSEPPYAAVRTENLQLATPAYYRQGNLKPGIGDRHDGTLTKDSTRWANAIMDAGVGVTNANVTYVSQCEPWVYCAAHYCNHRELDRLRGHFADEYGYTAATVITDPDAFAIWLGIDFALGLDKTEDVKLNALEGILYARSHYQTSLWEGSYPIDTIVHIYHGPVCHEDCSGRIDTQEQWYDPDTGPKSWFTKRVSFASQNEYRFAVSTIGEPVRPLHYIAVSPELRTLAMELF